MGRDSEGLQGSGRGLGLAWGRPFSPGGALPPEATGVLGEGLLALTGGERGQVPLVCWPWSLVFGALLSPGAKAQRELLEAARRVREVLSAQV